MGADAGHGKAGRGNAYYGQTAADLANIRGQFALLTAGARGLC
jgi:hypothetical protein